MVASTVTDSMIILILAIVAWLALSVVVSLLVGRILRACSLAAPEHGSRPLAHALGRAA